jgi:tripartite-type tricarboxylate transporter receptor subunit TctC
MTLSRRRFHAWATLPLAAPWVARAQGSKPLRLVIPGPPGGASDIIARILEGELTRLLGQTLVIEPRPGAGGNVATEMVAKAPPDGQTILFGDIGPLAINVSLYPSLRYDPVRDFEPIAKVAVFPWIVAAHPSLGVRSLADLFELARRTPEGLPFATPGQGTPMHLTGAMLSKVSGAAFRHVPYKGGGPATMDVLAGHVKLGIVGLPPAIPHVKTGALIGIGVSTGTRAPQLPEVPTLQEGGMKDFDAGVWYGFLAPRGTPRAVVDRINAATRAALSNPAVIENLDKRAVVPAFSSPEAFRALIEAEGRRWGPLVKASGATPE